MKTNLWHVQVIPACRPRFALPLFYQCVHFYVRAFYLLFHLKSIYFKFRHCNCVFAYCTFATRKYIFSNTLYSVKGFYLFILFSFLFQGVGVLRIPYTFLYTVEYNFEKGKNYIVRMREGCDDDDDEAFMFDSILFINCY